MNFRAIIFSMFLFVLVSSCGSKKRILRETAKIETKESGKTNLKVKETVKTDLTENSNLQLNTVTNHYGDSLTGSQPIDSNGVSIESSGLKLNASLQTVKDKKGNTTGYRLNYKLTAKPTGKTNTNSQLQTNAKAKVAVKKETQLAEENKATAQATINRDERETKKAFSFPGWVYALLFVIALVAAFVFFKPIINFIKTWTN